MLARVKAVGHTRIYMTQSKYIAVRQAVSICSKDISSSYFIYYTDKNAQAEKFTKLHESVKLDRIIEIWRANKGVICLPVFHNITPVEAYTREAAIIDCLGVENLANIKRGDYYGIAKSWTMRDRKKLGVLLLYKAMQVFAVEGESQLRPNDIK